MPSARLSALVALLPMIACASPDAPRGSAAPSAAAPGFAPTPYSADQIRESNPTGTVLTYRIQTQGQPELTSTFEFGEADQESVLLGGRVLDAEGNEVQGTEARRVRWDELRDHAKFPAGACVREEARATTPAGSFDCWLYTIEDQAAGTTSRFWFARERAGSPVVMSVVQAGEEVYRMELLSIRTQE